MKKILLPAIFAIIFLSACNERGIDYDTTLSTAQPETLPALPVADSNIVVTNTFNQQSLPSVPVQPNAVKSNVSLNPAHGRPNHRCDIAVGAPLSSPSQGVQQTVPAMPALPATLNPITNTGGEVKLNPEHGMPGHDCGIAVGEPLKG